MTEPGLTRATKKKVAILMRTRNSAWIIAETLKSLFSQDFTHFQLTIIDSSSSDGTLELVKEHPATVHVIPESDYYPGKVLNSAIAALDADLVVFLNSDAVLLTPSSLGNLIAAFDDPKVQAAFGRQVPRSDAELWVRRDYALAFPATEPAPVWQPFSLGFAAMRLSIWLRRPFYTRAWGSEDTEWGYWAHNHGFTVRYVPDALCVHSHNYSLQQVYGRCFIEGEASAFFPHASFSFWQFIARSVKSSLRDLGYYLQQGEWRGLLTIFPRRLVYHWGFYQGYLLGCKRLKNKDRDASQGQRVVFKNYDDR